MWCVPSSLISLTIHSMLTGDSLISAAQAKQQATYEALGWDFTTVWKIEEGTGYPKLMWE